MCSLAEMAARVPVQHFGLRSSASASASAYIGSPLHDLNAVDPRPADIDSIGRDDRRRGRNGVAEDDLDNEDDSSAVVGVRVWLV